MEKVQLLLRQHVGAPCAPCVAVGDKVKKGQLLVEFDIDHILQEGYNLETPVIITNTKDYSNINTNTNKDNVVLVAEA